MRYSAAVATALVLAPLSMASQINNLYPRDVKRAVYARAPESFEKRTEAEKSRMSESVRGMKEESSTENLKKGESKERESSTQEEPQIQIELGGGSGGSTGSVDLVRIIWVKGAGETERKSISDKVIVTEKLAGTGVNAAEGAQETHTIKVGGPGGLVYSPAVNKLEVGAMVVWEFYSKNHTVTQSTFDKPCEKMEGGFDTGFMPNPNDTEPPPQVAMQVMTSEPLWFKCSQGKHCSQGMVASINAKDGEKSHSAFQEKAVKSGEETAGAASSPNSTTPAGQEGGSNKEQAKEPPSTSTRPEASTGSSSSRPESSAGSGGRTEGGGAVGQVGAADGATTVATGTGTMINGVCNCVATCGNGGASSSQTKQKRSVVERRQASGGQPCPCIALCGSMTSTDSSGGIKAFLPTAKMAAAMAAGNAGSASGSSGTSSTGSASGASGTSNAGSAKTTSSLGSSMSSMAGMSGMAAQR